MELRRVRLDDATVTPLLAGLAHEYDTRYGANGELARTTADEFDPPGGAFIVVLDGDVTAAGGGFRRFSEGAAEIKRMWTNPSHRRRGLATEVLAALEAAAAEAGYTRLVLETGPRQPEARSLYEGRGYRSIPTYGPYDQALAFELELLDRLAP
jgi:GNAT superfamily N-acetyltransferase